MARIGDVIDLSVVAVRYQWGEIDPFATGHVRFVQSGDDVRLLLDVDGGGADAVTLVTLANANANSLGAANLATKLSTAQDLGPDPTPPGGGAGGVLYGTEFNDVLYASAQYPHLVGLGGEDQLFGSVENNILEGGADNDVLMDDAGNDTLDGGTGVDRMEGGAGDDLYIVDHMADAAIEQANGGFDTDPFDRVQSRRSVIGQYRGADPGRGRHHERHRQ